MPITLSPPQTQVIIVGAGPTGLMAAVLLARCGVSLRIFSKDMAPTTESRAIGLQPKSLELFLSMGLAELFLNKGILVSGAEIFMDGKQAAELSFDDIGRTDTPYPFILLVPQGEIEGILVEDLKRLGIQVELGVEVTDLEQDDDGVVVRARDASGTTLQARAQYLIGADGAHSVVREKLGLCFEGAPYPQGFLLADCKIDWPLDHDQIKLFLHGTKLAVYLPLRGLESGRLIVLSESKGDQGAHPVTLAEVQAAVCEASGMPVTLSHPLWISRYTIHHRGVDQYVQGRVFVAGDAAHIHSPVGGQGMNTGLQDSANLAWKLALVLRGGGPVELLDSYHDERWPVGHKTLRFTDRIFALISSQKSWLAGIRNRLLPRFAGTVSKSGTLRSKAFHFISQLGIRYNVPIFLHDDGRYPGGLNAGERAPNAAISRHQDIFGLLQGYQFHVLAISRRPLSELEIDKLHQDLEQLPRTRGVELATHIVAHSLIGRDPRIHRCESSQIWRAYGLNDETPEALFLIRPDGYVAYRSRQLNVAGLSRFLRDRLGGQS